MPRVAASCPSIRAGDAARAGAIAGHAGRWTGFTRCRTPASDADYPASRRRAQRPQCAWPRRDGATLGIGVPLAMPGGPRAFDAGEGSTLPIRCGSARRVIDDTYNANPDSVAAAIAGAWPGARAALAGAGRHGRGRYAGRGVPPGDRGCRRARPASSAVQRRRRSGGRRRRLRRRCTSFRAAERLASRHCARALGARMTVLVKGSRFMRMEHVVRVEVALRRGRLIRCCLNWPQWLAQSDPRFNVFSYLTLRAVLAVPDRAGDLVHRRAAR